MNILHLIILCLILLTIPNLTDHMLLRNILGFVLVFLLLCGTVKKTTPIKLAMMSLLVILFLEMIGPMMCGSSVESFENVNELVETIEKDSKSKKTKKETDKEEKRKKIKAKLEEIATSGDKINIEEIEALMGGSDDDDTYMMRKKKSVSEMTPHEAQQETYEIMNTVKELNETLEALTPQLQTAKKTLEAYKQLNLA